MLESESDVKVDNFQKCFNSIPKLVVKLLSLTLLGTTKTNGNLIVVLTNRLVGTVR
jgi:hypothetical protein